MVIPGYIQTLDEYWVWVEQEVERCGARLEGSGFLVIYAIVDEDERVLSLDVDSHRLRFVDGSYLDFDFVVNAELELVDYRFHYAREDDTIVWREDRHPGHEEEDGTDVHVHLPGNKREPSEPTDLGEILDRIHADQEQRQDSL